MIHQRLAEQGKAIVDFNRLSKLGVVALQIYQF
jgi:hypothetical protein